MAQSDEQIKDGLETVPETGMRQLTSAKKSAQVSRKVSDHLANERTFLAWMRTGLATIAFGFVVECFGLLLRQRRCKHNIIGISAHYSSFFRVALAGLGLGMMIVALLNFLHI